MPIVLRPSITPRERILSFGVGGTGKSNAILEVARKCPTDNFFVLDNDLAYERLLATDFTDVEERGNVHVINIDEWPQYVDMVNASIDKAEKDDWLVIDSMSPSWDHVQSWFIEQIFGNSIEDYFLEVRKKKQEAKEKKKTLGALDGWMDWPVINKQYARLYTRLLNFPGHIYLTAEQASISDDDDKEVKGLFGSYGVKPKGQKRMGYVVSTVLLLTKSRVGEYGMTTVKDRGREEMEDWEVGNWAVDYLMKVAGWRPAKV